MGDPNKERNAHENPSAARTDKNPPSERGSDKADTHTDKGTVKSPDKKPSVKAKLERYKAEAARQKEAERSEPTVSKAEERKPEPNRQTVHQQPKRKKPKER